MRARMYYRRWLSAMFRRSGGVMDGHSRLTCRTVPDVFWRGDDVPCIWCGCDGELTGAFPDLRGRAGLHSYVASEDMTFWGRAA